MSVKLEQIQAGDIVIRSGNEVRLAVPVNGIMAIVAKDEWNPAKDYIADIEAVYRPLNNRAASKVFSETDKVFYEVRSSAPWNSDYSVIYKADEEIKEVTLEEVAKKFDIDVSKLRIKE